MIKSFFYNFVKTLNGTKQPIYHLMGNIVIVMGNVTVIVMGNQYFKNSTLVFFIIGIKYCVESQLFDSDFLIFDKNNFFPG